MSNVHMLHPPTMANSTTVTIMVDVDDNLYYSIAHGEGGSAGSSDALDIVARCYASTGRTDASFSMYAANRIRLTQELLLRFKYFLSGMVFVAGTQLLYSLIH